MAATEIQLGDLENLGLANLRQAWEKHYGTSVPATMSLELLRLSIGYKLQENLYGGLSRKTIHQVSATKFDSETRNLIRVSVPKASPKSGTKFIREWRGKVHEVSVAEDGKFAYHDRLYNSLTIIAREITGAHQSGPKFFGIKVPPAAEANDRSSLG